VELVRTTNETPIVKEGEGKAFSPFPGATALDHSPRRREDHPSESVQMFMNGWFWKESARPPSFDRRERAKSRDSR